MTKSRLPGTAITRRTALVGGLATSIALGSQASVSRALADNSKPFKLGASTQIAFPYGRDTRDGLTFAIEEINASGGILGRPIELVFEDETTTPEGAANAMRKLLSEGIEAHIGHSSTGNFLAQMPIIAEAKIITLIVGAGATEITQKIAQDYDTYKYIFRTTINAARQGELLLDFTKGFVIGELGYKKIAILSDNSKWGQEVVKSLQAGAAEVGGEVTTVEIVSPGTDDFTPALSRIKDSGAQYFITALVYAKTDVLAKQWFDAKYPLMYGGLDGFAADDGFFKRVDGKNISQITAVFGAREPITPKTIPYYDKFKAKFGRTPGYQCWTAENTLYVYKQAVERAKTFEADKVVPELEKTKYAGVDGIIEFDKTHDALSGPGHIGWYFTQWQGDGKRPLLWPKALRSGTFIKAPWIGA